MSTIESSNDAALNERLGFIGLNAESCASIARLKPVVERALPGALDSFYEKVRATPQVRRFFEGEAHIGRAKDAQIGHWNAIVSGTFNNQYHANVRRIGEAHAHTGLEPRWYVGGYGLIAEKLVSAAIEEHWPKGFINRGRKGAAKAFGASLGALVKAIFLDMDISISVYLEAEERARLRQEEERAKERAEALAKEQAAAREAEKARVKQDAESALRLYLNEAAVATFVLDREHRVIMWNKACARLTGLDAAAVMGTKDHWKGFYTHPRPVLADLALSGDTAAVDAQYAGRERQTSGSANLSAENWCDLPNGKHLYLAIDASPIHDETGAVIAVVETLHDLTPAKAAEAAREAEDKRAKEQAEALSSERAGVVAAIGEGLAKLAAQDLTFRIHGQMPEAYVRLQADFNSAIDRLTSVVEAAVESSRALRVGTSEISAAADDFSRRTEQQAASLEETTSALGEITGSVRRTADVSKQARNVVAATRSASHEGAETVRKAVEAMRMIEKSSQQIGQIIGVIDEIAFQTNLLALNAGVEAARAGDAGRGFAVVASEVRALAQRSAEAAKEIKGLIATSSTQVHEGVTLVADTGKAFEQIESGVNNIAEVVEQISKGSEEEATGLQEINSAMGQLDQVTQQNAAMAEESSAASRSLAEQGERLAQLISQFRTGRSAEDPIERELKKAAPHAFRPAAAPAPDAGRRASARVSAPAAQPRRVAAARSASRARGAEAEDHDWTEF